MFKDQLYKNIKPYCPKLTIHISLYITDIGWLKLPLYGINIYTFELLQSDE